MSLTVNSLREEETYGAVMIFLFFGQNRGFRRGGYVFIKPRHNYTLDKLKNESAWAPGGCRHIAWSWSIITSKGILIVCI